MQLKKDIKIFVNDAIFNDLKSGIDFLYNNLNTKNVSSITIYSNNNQAEVIPYATKDSEDLLDFIQELLTA